MCTALILGTGARLPCLHGRRVWWSFFRRRASGWRGLGCRGRRDGDFWPDEQKPERLKRWTLRCNPVGGSLPTRRVACRRLAGMTPAAFAPVPRDAICTQIWGGPQKAVLKGTLRGKRVWASFRRRNGCEIERWQRFSPWLIPPGGTTS
jgi:hypothetical protein